MLGLKSIDKTAARPTATSVTTETSHTSDSCHNGNNHRCLVQSDTKNSARLAAFSRIHNDTQNTVPSVRKNDRSLPRPAASAATQQRLAAPSRLNIPNDRQRAATSDRWKQPVPSRLAASATTRQRLAASSRETSATTDNFRRRLSARATGAHHDWQRPRQASNVWQRHPVNHPQRPTTFGDVCPLEQPGPITIGSIRDKPATSGSVIP